MLKNIKPKSAVLFDLDGTILDTAHDLTSAFNQVIHKHTGKTYSLAETRKLVGYGSKELFMHALGNKIDKEKYEQFRLDFSEAYKALSHQSTALFEGMDSVIEYLNASHIPWGIVTNKPYVGAVHAVEAFPILKSNQCVVGCDTADYPKPAAEPLLFACEALGVSVSETCFIGDTPTDMQAAHNANMDCIAVSYGYGMEDILSSRWKATATIDHPTELLDLPLAGPQS